MWSGSYGRCLFTTSQQHSSRTAPGFGTEQNGVGALAGAEDEARSLDLFEASLGLWVERCDKTQGIGHDLFLSG